MQKVNFPWEIIVADDCSPDNTRNIILEYKNRYPDLIRLLFQEKNVGGGKNFVDLLNAAEGKYIAYLEGDDYWTDENKLQKQFDFMESNPDFSMSYHRANWEFMYESEEWKSYPPSSNIGDSAVSTVYDILNRGWAIRSCTMFFRPIGLPSQFEKLRVGDYPLHILLADKGNIGFIDECMGTYRIHSNGLSETQILVYDVPTRTKNHAADIYLWRYLNRETGYKYSSIFKKKIFDELYGFHHFLLNKSKGLFIITIIRTMFTYNPFFIISQLFLKIFQKARS